MELKHEPDRPISQRRQLVVRRARSDAPASRTRRRASAGRARRADAAACSCPRRSRRRRPPSAREHLQIDPVEHGDRSAVPTACTLSPGQPPPARSFVSNRLHGVQPRRLQRGIDRRHRRHRQTRQHDERHVPGCVETGRWSMKYTDGSSGMSRFCADQHRRHQTDRRAADRCRPDQ